jgi:hypothetical protein
MIEKVIAISNEFEAQLVKHVDAFLEREISIEIHLR